MKQFIIFAHARSGSTTLARALKSHPEISLREEPFSRSRDQWKGNHVKYRDFLTEDVSSLDQQLKEIFSICNSFKHLQGQLSPDFNKHLLNKGYNVVFLYRKNLLQAAVSREISIMSSHWGSDRSKILNKTYSAIDIESIRNFIRYISECKQLYLDFINQNNVRHFELAYEDLFSPEKNLESRMQKFGEIVEFLGLKPIPSELKYNQDTVKRLLSPKTKLNTAETYGLFPNIREIEEEFSEFGNIF